MIVTLVFGSIFISCVICGLIMIRNRLKRQESTIAHLFVLVNEAHEWKSEMEKWISERDQHIALAHEHINKIEKKCEQGEYK